MPSLEMKLILVILRFNFTHPYLKSLKKIYLKLQDKLKTYQIPKVQKKQKQLIVMESQYKINAVKAKLMKIFMLKIIFIVDILF